MYANLLKVLQIRQRTPTLNVKLHTDATLLTKTLIYKMIYLFQVVRRHLEKTTYMINRNNMKQYSNDGNQKITSDITMCRNT